MKLCRPLGQAVSLDADAPRVSSLAQSGRETSDKRPFFSCALSSLPIWRCLLPVSSGRWRRSPSGFPVHSEHWRKYSARWRSPSANRGDKRCWTYLPYSHKHCPGCRNQKQLRAADRPPTAEEIELAVLQFVRKVSGYRQPSRANEAAFQTAVAEISAATRQLLDSLVDHRPRHGTPTPISAIWP